MRSYNYAIIQEKMSEMQSLFTKAQMNRTILCDEKGVLRPENKRYKKSYLELLTEIGNLFREVCLEELRLYYFDDSESCKEKSAKISALYDSLIPGIIKAIKIGKFNELVALYTAFTDGAFNIWTGKDMAVEGAAATSPLTCVKEASGKPGALLLMEISRLTEHFALPCLKYGHQYHRHYHHAHLCVVCP